MIAVVFEVELKAGKKSQYLDIAADLKPMLEKIEGFISVERFKSLGNEGKIIFEILKHISRLSCQGWLQGGILFLKQIGNPYVDIDQSAEVRL